MKLRNKKTGEVTEEVYVIFDGLKIGNDLSDHSRLYKSLEELEEDWEDYKPIEPLIKDEKIRSAIMAWAKAVGTNSAYVEKGCYENDQFVLSDGLAEIHFRISTPEEIKSYKRYTIAELCGEEKEYD